VRRALAAALLLLLLPMVSGQATLEKVTLEVYSSGYVKVTETLSPGNYSVAVEVPLLSENVTGLAVFDENGKPLLFEKNGSTLTVYVVNSTSRITVVYFTAELTSKKGEIWNLSYSFPFPVTIKLPKGAIVVDLSDVPLTITSDSITMPPGNQSVAYLLPPPTTSSATSTQTTTLTSSTAPSTTSPETSTVQPSSPGTTTSSSQEQGSTTGRGRTNTPQPSGGNSLPIAGLLAVVAVPAIAYWARKRGGKELPVSREELKERLESMNLTEEEINALLYVYDQGGKAKQADVRKALGIPKTTAWRMFKRLEERGLVRVYKRGKENWVELVF